MRAPAGHRIQSDSADQFPYNLIWTSFYPLAMVNLNSVADTKLVRKFSALSTPPKLKD